MKVFLKSIIILLFICCLLGVGFVLLIQFWGEGLYIKAVEEKKYALIKIYLKINPRLINTKINEYYCGFDKGLFDNDVQLLELLEPYTKKINAVDKGSGLKYSGAISSCLQRYGFNSLEYLLKNNLIKTKALLPTGDTYQDYLDFLLRIANNPNKDNCGRLLIKYGADPYKMNGRSCVIIDEPEYLKECYSAQGIKAFVKFKDVMMKYYVLGDAIEKVKRFLVEFENRKDLPEADLAYIKEFNRFLKEDYNMNLIKTVPDVIFAMPEEK